MKRLIRFRIVLHGNNKSLQKHECNFSRETPLSFIASKNLWCREAPQNLCLGGPFLYAKVYSYR